MIHLRETCVIFEIDISNCNNYAISKYDVWGKDRPLNF